FRNGVYYSGDGGKTWQYRRDAGVIFSAGWFGHGDPACAYGVNGEAYYATLKGSGAPPREKSTYESWPHEANYIERMQFYRSPDGGQHWNGPLNLGFIDHETIVVDTTNDRYRGRIYIYGNPLDRLGKNGNNLWIIYSKDGGH